MAFPQVEVSLGRKATGIRDSGLVRLIQALRDLDDRAADSVVDEIRLLKLAGVRIDLLLTATEKRRARLSPRLTAWPRNDASTGSASFSPSCGQANGPQSRE
jgi:hypothetical protein